MKYPPEKIEMLLREAKSASENTYSPYSGSAAGAAVLATDGHIFSGTNIENASYGLTVCAERVAIGNAISAGSDQIEAIAIHGPDDSISPCGACRQFILEFGRNIIVIFRKHGKIMEMSIEELLPFAFSMKV